MENKVVLKVFERVASISSHNLQFWRFKVSVFSRKITFSKVAYMQRVTKTNMIFSLDTFWAIF